MARDFVTTIGWPAVVGDSDVTSTYSRKSRICPFALLSGIVMVEWIDLPVKINRDSKK